MTTSIVEAYLTLETMRIAISAFIFLVVLIALSSLFGQSKSKKARELFGDLFIIGTIRKLADEDGIDLEVELREMRKMEKLERATTRSIDRMVEVELNEKISAKNQEALAKLNK